MLQHRHLDPSLVCHSKTVRRQALIQAHIIEHDGLRDISRILVRLDVPASSQVHEVGLPKQCFEIPIFNLLLTLGYEHERFVCQNLLSLMLVQSPCPENI